MRDKKKRLFTIIAIIVVIVVVIGLGIYVLIPGPDLATHSPCVAIPGYYCSSMIYSHVTGNLTGQIGEQNGNWTGWAIAYAPENTRLNSNNIPNVMFSEVPNVIIINSGTHIYIPNGVLPVSGKNTSIRSETIGWIWACYTISSGVIGMTGGVGSCTPIGNKSATVNFTRIAIIDITAT